MHLAAFRTPAVAFLMATCGALFATQPAPAQESTRGYNLTIFPTVEASDLDTQPDLWTMEVSFKPMRMIRVEVTDPVTKQKSSQLVWYLVWKAVNRTIERPAEEGVPKPVNEADPVPRSFFVPEFTLVTNDNGVQRVYPDMIIPEAQAAISARERAALKNSVEIVQPMPNAVPAGTDPPTVIEGVAMWAGIDPNTDYFTVFASGFASAYRITNGPDGQPLVWRKTIIQEFWRPSDHIDEAETEIRRLDELQPSKKAQHSPRWIFRADGDVSPNPQDLPPVEEKAAGGDEAAPANEAAPAEPAEAAPADANGGN